MANSIEDLKARIIKLERERDQFLGTHRTLMDAYKIGGAAEVKRRASQALDEAGKRNKRIAELRVELAALEGGGNSN